MGGRSAAWQALGLLCLTLVAWLPGLGRQEFVGTEDLRVQVAREMLQNGDWLVPSLHGRPLLTKPPLHAWVLAGAMTLTGRSDPFTARLPSLLALAAVVTAAGLAARRAGGPRAGWVAGAGYLLALNTLKNGANAEIDPLFAALTAGMVLAWGRAVEEGGPGSRALLAGLLGGLAALAKGPAVLPFLAGALLAGPVAGRGRPRLGPLLAFLLPLLALGLAWPVALALRGIPEGAVGQGSELLLAWTPERCFRTLTWPLALLVAGAPLALVVPWRLRAPGRAFLDRYLVAAVLVAFLLLLIPANKSTRYLLPCLPLMAVAGALRLELRGATPAFVRGVAAAFLVAAAAALPFLARDLPPRGAAVLGALALAAVVAARLAPRAPALALALLVVPARATVPGVYVPVWEARGESLRPAAAALGGLLEGRRRLAVVALQTPRLYLGLPVTARWYPDLRSLAEDLEGEGGPEAILLPAERLSETGLPGWRVAGRVPLESRREVVVLIPAAGG